MCISYFVNPFVSQNPTPERDQVIENLKSRLLEIVSLLRRGCRRGVYDATLFIINYSVVCSA